MGKPQKLADGYVAPSHTPSIGIEAVSKMVLDANQNTPPQAIHDTLRTICNTMNEVSESLALMGTVYATARPGVDYSMWMHMSDGGVADVVQSVNGDGYYLPHDDQTTIFGQGVKAAHLRLNNYNIAGGWWDAPAEPNPLLHTLVSQTDTIQAYLRVDGRILLQQSDLTNDTSDLPDTIIKDADSHCQVFSMIEGPVKDVGTACGSLPARSLMLEQFMSTQRYRLHEEQGRIPDMDVTVTTAPSEHRPYLFETCTELPAGLKNHTLCFGNARYNVRRVNLEDRKSVMTDAIKATRGTRYIQKMRETKTCLEIHKRERDDGWESDDTDKTEIANGDDDANLEDLEDANLEDAKIPARDLSYSQAAKYVQDMGLLTVEMVILWETRGCMPAGMPPYGQWPTKWADNWTGFDSFVQFEEFEVCLPDTPDTPAMTIRRGALGTTAVIMQKCETVTECANYVSIATWANQWVYPLTISKRPSCAAVLVFTDTQLTDKDVLTCCGFAPLHPETCAYGVHTDIIGALVVPGQVTPGQRYFQAESRSWAHACIGTLAAKTPKAAAGAEKRKKITPHEYRIAGRRVSELCENEKINEAAGVYAELMHCVISAQPDPAVNAAILDLIAQYLFPQDVASVKQLFVDALPNATPNADMGIIDAANTQYFNLGEGILKLAENDYRALVQLWDGDGDLDKDILSVPFGPEACRNVESCFQRFREDQIVNRCYNCMDKKGEIEHSTLIQNVTAQTSITEEEVNIQLDKFAAIDLWECNKGTWTIKPLAVDEAFEKHFSALLENNPSSPATVAIERAIQHIIDTKGIAKVKQAAKSLIQANKLTEENYAPRIVVEKTNKDNCHVAYSQHWKNDTIAQKNKKWDNNFWSLVFTPSEAIVVLAFMETQGAWFQKSNKKKSDGSTSGSDTSKRQTAGSSLKISRDELPDGASEATQSGNGGLHVTQQLHELNQSTHGTASSAPHTAEHHAPGKGQFIPRDNSSSDEEEEGNQTPPAPAADLTGAINSFLDYLLDGSTEDYTALRSDIIAATKRATDFAVGHKVKPKNLQSHPEHNGQMGYINGGPYEDKKNKTRWSIAMLATGKEILLLPLNFEVVITPGFSDARPKIFDGCYLVDNERHGYTAFKQLGITAPTSKTPKRHMYSYSVHVPDLRHRPVQYNTDLACLRFTDDEYRRCYRQIQQIVREKQQPATKMGKTNQTHRLG